MLHIAVKINNEAIFSLQMKKTASGSCNEWILLLRFRRNINEAFDPKREVKTGGEKSEVASCAVMQSLQEEKINTVEMCLIIEAVYATKCGPMHSSDVDCALPTSETIAHAKARK